MLHHYPSFFGGGRVMAVAIFSELCRPNKMCMSRIQPVFWFEVFFLTLDLDVLRDIKSGLCRFSGICNTM